MTKYWLLTPIETDDIEVAEAFRIETSVATYARAVGHAVRVLGLTSMVEMIPSSEDLFTPNTPSLSKESA